MAFRALNLREVKLEGFGAWRVEDRTESRSTLVTTESSRTLRT